MASLPSSVHTNAGSHIALLMQDNWGEGRGKIARHQACCRACIQRIAKEARGLKEQSVSTGKQHATLNSADC